MTGWLAISLGDVTGIGPEVTLKALAAELDADQWRYLLIGDGEWLQRINAQLGLHIPLKPFQKGTEDGRVFFHSPVDALTADLPPASPLAARAAVAWLAEGASVCLGQTCDALVTAPVNKEAIIRSGLSFVGQTEYLSALAGTDQTIMMLLGPDDRQRWLRTSRGGPVPFDIKLIDTVVASYDQYIHVGRDIGP